MTKWKTQNPDTLIMMHAHNRWSRFNSLLVQAAADLGVPVCVRESPNHYDGSRDVEYTVPHGMKRRITTLAHERQYKAIEAGTW